MEIEGRKGETGDRTDIEFDEGIDDEPVAPEGLGALGQLAVAVVVVAVLVAAFIGGSALLRRIFG
jgi:hypothetical protein